MVRKISKTKSKSPGHLKAQVLRKSGSGLSAEKPPELDRRKLKQIEIALREIERYERLLGTPSKPSEKRLSRLISR